MDPMGKPKPQLSGKRATVEQNGSEIWSSVVSVQCIRVIFGVKRLRSFWDHSAHFRILTTLIPKTAGRRAQRSEIWASG